MQLRDELQARLEREDSMFRAQLLREDIARLDKLVALASDSEDLAAFKKAGTYIGWTQNDMMTHVLKEPLGDLMEAIYAWRWSEGDEAAIRDGWLAFCAARNEKLIKCL